MSADDILLTPEGMERLRGELKHLVNEEMPDLLRRLAEARAHGDLSENAEYHAVKERKAATQSRVDELSSILSYAKVFVPTEKMGAGHCIFGAFVNLRVKRSDNKRVTKREFQLVSSHEADSSTGKLSIQSPLGMELLGKTSGDIVEIDAPAGRISYEIISVSYSS